MYTVISLSILIFQFCFYRKLLEKDGEPQPSKDTQTEGEEAGKGDQEGGLEKGEKESSESEKDKESGQSKCWSQDKLKTLYRKFNLDLAPKVSNRSVPRCQIVNLVDVS